MAIGQIGLSGHLVVAAAMEEPNTEQDTVIDQPLFMVEGIVLVTAWRHDRVIYKPVLVKGNYLSPKCWTPV